MDHFLNFDSNYFIHIFLYVHHDSQKKSAELVSILNNGDSHLFRFSNVGYFSSRIMDFLCLELEFLSEKNG